MPARVAAFSGRCCWGARIVKAATRERPSLQPPRAKAKPATAVTHRAARRAGKAERGSDELEDHRIDGEAVALLGGDRRDGGVALRAQHVLHLHGLDDGERLARLHLLPGLDEDRL